MKKLLKYSKSHQAKKFFKKHPQLEIDFKNCLKSIARNEKRSPMLGFKSPLKNKFGLRKIDDIRTKYYIRLKVLDKAGALAKISNIFGDFDISIEKMLQKPIIQNGKTLDEATLLLSTHTCREKELKSAIEQLQQQSCIVDKPFFIRIEE